MWPDRVSSPGPLTYESGALPIALRGPATPEDHILRMYKPFKLLKRAVTVWCGRMCRMVGCLNAYRLQIESTMNIFLHRKRSFVHKIQHLS